MYGFVIWVQTPHSQVGGYQCSGGTCCLKNVVNHRALLLHNVTAQKTIEMHSTVTTIQVNSRAGKVKCFIQRYL
jgi:hypothetical protein